MLSIEHKKLKPVANTMMANCGLVGMVLVLVAFSAAFATVLASTVMFASWGLRGRLDLDSMMEVGTPPWRKSGERE